MKISFNLINVGLGSNGGSQTIIESANTLQELGCEVTIVDGGKNLNTWNQIKCKHLIIKNLNDFPSGDVVIATGYKTVESTLKLKNSCGKKYHWIRGLETWVFDEKYIIKNIFQNDLKKIVNSICLQRKLGQYKIPSEIIRPGHNFQNFSPLNIRKNNKKIIIGGLYNQGTKRSKKRTEWIFNCYDILKKKYDIDLWMFGSDGIPIQYCDTYMRNPDIKDKNMLYNRIDIWLSPSQLEGLHIAPQEAMLTECCVVGNNSEMSGTEDYLIDHETGLVSENNFKAFLASVEILVKHEMMRKEFGKKGREKILSLGDRKVNMLKLIDFLKG